MDWEIFGDQLLWLEIYAAVALLLISGLWVPFRKVPVSLSSLIIVCGLLFLGSFRSAYYNSDTKNYYEYFYYISSFSVFDGLFSTKIEPIHSLMISFFKDFRFWLLAESVLEIIGMILAYNHRKNDYSFLVLCAFIITLSTSSLRYCASLIFFYCFICRYKINLHRAFWGTLVLSCIHISMLLSGALAIRRKVSLAAIAALCVAILFFNSILGSRLDFDPEESSGGLKVFSISLISLFYVFITLNKEKKLLTYYIIAFFAIFSVSIFVLPTFNRFLIMGTLVVLSLEWPNPPRKRHLSVFDRGFALTLCGMVVVPYILFLPSLYYSGRW